MADIHAAKSFSLDADTFISLGVAFSLMPVAQLLAAYTLPKTISKKLRYIFIWHAYDFLTHFIIEGSFLYHCFYSYIELPPATSDYPHPASLTPAGVYFLADKTRRYGPLYASGPMAKLWQEYAKADHRWGGADLTVISLELLTVGLEGPAAMYICYLIYKIAQSPPASQKPKLQGRLWFIAILVATGELYGGFMTFAPEWLSGNSQLQGDDPVYLWLYLVFFNVLWVFAPSLVLWEAWSQIEKVFEMGGQTAAGKKGK